VNMSPLFPYITGFVANEGTEPTNRCSTCLSGETEACIQTAQFGYICRETDTLETSVLIERINAGEVNLTLINDILGAQGDILAALRSYDRGTVLNVANAWAMLEVGMMFQNKLNPLYWQGNPANNIGNGYMEFPGLNILVGANKFDTLTGARCEALDSDVKNFNYQNVNTILNGNFLAVQQLSMLEEYVYWNAEGQQLNPVEWAWFMRPGLWRELTEIWPFAYLTTRNLVLPAGNTNFFDGVRMNDMRDEMRRGRTLEVNGRPHPVILDTGIFENNSTNNANLLAGEFASDIYLLPMSYLGGRPGVYLQHKDYRLIGPEVRAANGNVADNQWTDDGRFRWTTEQQKFCYTISGSVEPRIILKVPQLAGRLNNVMYVPVQHLRDADENSDYFYKGGVSMRNAASYYSDWNVPRGQ